MVWVMASECSAGTRGVSRYSRLTVGPARLVPDGLLKLALVLEGWERGFKLSRGGQLGVRVGGLVVLGHEAVPIAVDEQHGGDLIQMEVLMV